LGLRFTKRAFFGSTIYFGRDFAVAVVFIYYNLNEKKNQTGTFEAIESIGSDH